MDAMMERMSLQYEAKFKASAEAKKPFIPDPVPAVVKRLRDKYSFLKSDESRWPKMPVDVALALRKYGASDKFIDDLGVESRVRSWYNSVSTFDIDERFGWSEFSMLVMQGRKYEVLLHMQVVEDDEGPDVLKEFMEKATEGVFATSFVTFAVFGKQRTARVPDAPKDMIARSSGIWSRKERPWIKSTAIGTLRSIKAC
jgi:hypothetical protein